MQSTTSPGGRPKTVYYPKSGGDPIVGLARLADGRWKVSGPPVLKFTEPDERLAIARFHAIQTQRNPNGNWVDLPVGEADANQISPLVEKATKGRLSVKIPHDPTKPLQVAQGYDEQALWAYVREQLIMRPKWVAERVGIEQLAYLTDLKPSEVVPTFPMLTKIWEEHFQSSPEQRQKCPVAFADFVKVSGVTSIDQITPAAAVAYRDHVYSRGSSPKTQSNVFTRVRRYLTFFRDRAIAIDTINRALGYLALLVPSESTVTLDPRPIDPDDFKSLLAAAEGDNRAMVLLMLNAAMYLQEVIRLQWSDIKEGCLVTRRAKTARCIRVAVLWPETVEALALVDRKGKAIFLNYAGSQLGIKGAEKRWRDLRKKAKVDVTASQLRDGAYTAAVEANVSSQLCQLLVGHRSGMADHYVQRKPAMVAPACDAIRSAYFGG
jgi:integrase